MQQQPHRGQRVDLPALRPAAAAALDTDPRELIARWLDALSPTAKRSYRRSLAQLAAWSLADDAAPEAALQMLCSLDVGLALGQWSSLSAAKRYIDERSEERASALRLVDM